MLAAQVTAGWFLEHAYLVPLLMLASFALTLAIGKRLGNKASWIGIGAISICFLFAIATNVQWNSYVHDSEHAAESAHEVEGEHAEDQASADHASGDSAATGDHAETAAGEAGAEHHGPEFEVKPVQKTWTWFSSNGVDFEAGMLIDGMGVMMLFVVTLVSLLAYIFSTDYVDGDRRYTHYFAFLSLFSASMLGLIMASNTVQLITMWELVGMCSFALIGHWWEEKPNSDAAMKAFLTNRVGDVGLIVGVVVLFFAAGQTFDIIEINTLANEGMISHTALVVASCSLVAAVMSKSGQFILHTWLPDAMAGPTPVSALMHAATMVVAGIFMVARLYGVFWNGLTIGQSNINLLAVVGGVTVIGAAGLAFVQDDIKKVLAYSTVSQLGYMVLALGIGAWTAALFHLFTHAFFKAGLFLGAGSVSHSVHSFNMRTHMGGMKRFMPKTYLTFMICSGALIGIFPLAGFWSKDEILAGADQLGGDYTVFMVVGTIGALMTAAYMTRCIYLTFFGEFRGGSHDARDAHDSDDAEAHHAEPHESGPRILIPLYVLSGLAVVAGFTNIPNTGALDFVPDGLALRFEHLFEPKGAYFPSAGAVEGALTHPTFSLQIAIVSSIIGLIGIGLAYLFFFKGWGPHGLTLRSKLARTGHKVLVNKYYFDHLYTGVIAGAFKGPIAKAANWFNQKGLDGVVNGVGKGAVAGGRLLYTKIDQGVVDGIVNSSGRSADSAGQAFRLLQTGKVQQYAAIFFTGAVILTGIFIVVI